MNPAPNASHARTPDSSAAEIFEFGVCWSEPGRESFTVGGYTEAGARLMAAGVDGKGWSHTARPVRRPVGEWTPIDETGACDE